jgi:PPE-repeat protein
MWAQDVGAMVGYHGGATAVAESLTPFSLPPIDLAGWASQAVVGLATSGSGAVSPVVELVAGAPALVTGVQSLASVLPVQSLMSFAQVGAMPASMLIGPLMQAAQAGNTATAGLASATTGLAEDSTKFVGDAAPAMKGLGGGAGLGGGMAGDLGKAHLVGAMSVPPTWEGSTPKGMTSAAMRGLGAMPAAALQQAAATPTGGGMPMMPMPTGMGGAGAGMPGAMTGRGGAGSHVTQNRPSVIPRTGIG